MPSDSKPKSFTCHTPLVTLNGETVEFLGVLRVVVHHKRRQEIERLNVNLGTLFYRDLNLFNGGFDVCAIGVHPLGETKS